MSKNILLFIVLAIIVGSIIYLESTKPEIDHSVVESDIQIEDLEGEGESEATAKVLTEEDIQRIELKSKEYERAKELVDPEGYININNITITENIGNNVILVDFWTYSCINCQRTLPYLTAWDEKYRDDGLVIIGVHTPEFGFEKDYDNVVKATEKWGIEYPVVQDNDKQTWRSYKNRFWPRKYLIDVDGFIVYDHIGEGAYEETERIIQELLEERNEVLSIEREVDSEVVFYESEFTSGKTPELYFGYGFSRGQLGNKEGWQPERTVAYTLPETTQRNIFYLDGSWKNNYDSMELVEDGEIYLEYHAKDVNIVAGSENPVNLEIFVDGEKTKEVTVQDFDLYNIFSGEAGDHTLEIKAEEGLMAYTFTFG